VKPAQSRFLSVVSWVLIGAGLIGTAVMCLAIPFMPGGPVKGAVTLLPATVMFLTLSVGIGGMLLVLLSIDARLAQRSAGT